MLNLDYVEVEIRQAISKYKIRETGSIMKILLILLPPGDCKPAKWLWACISRRCRFRKAQEARKALGIAQSPPPEGRQQRRRQKLEQG